MSLFLNVLGHKWYFVAAGQLARQRSDNGSSWLEKS
jgi:hypothetical protein